MATCSSCGAEVLWGTMRGTGVPMPIDPPALPLEEVVPGVVAMRQRDRLAVVVTEEGASKVRDARWPEWTFHSAHWGSCPSAAEHRVNPDQERMEL